MQYRNSLKNGTGVITPVVQTCPDQKEDKTESVKEMCEQIIK